MCGFFFSDPPSYAPPPELAEFLQSGPPPVYIGFGSIVVDNPRELIDAVLAAVTRAGVRAIVSKGWSELAGPPNPNVFYIGDCPHGWLFQHIAAVVHHGGAGTTACGLLNGSRKVFRVERCMGDWLRPSAGFGNHVSPERLAGII